MDKGIDILALSFLSIDTFKSFWNKLGRLTFEKRERCKTGGETVLVLEDTEEK